MRIIFDDEIDGEKFVPIGRIQGGLELARSPFGGHARISTRPKRSKI